MGDLGPFEDLFILTPCLRDHPRSFPDNEDHEIIDIERCFPYIPIPQFEWKQTPTEKFMERLWAFKRINYLLDDQVQCTRGIDEFADNEELPETTTNSSETQAIDSKSNDDKCKEEAIRLALKYNFVTDVTSMIVEDEDEYDYYDSSYSYGQRSSVIRRKHSGLTVKSGGIVPFSSSSYNYAYDVAYYDSDYDSYTSTASTRSVATTTTAMSPTTTSPSICKMTMF